MNYWQEIYQKVVSDPRYHTGVTYGKPRTGRKEGTVANHLVDLEANLSKLKEVPFLLSEDDYWKLRVLVHVHDTLKLWAKRDSAIEDPKSHASLARKFLSEFTDDEDLLRIVQYHDEGYALWKQQEAKGKYNQKRFTRNVLAIRDVDLFLIFTLIDGYTPSKEHDRIRWFVDQVSSVRQTSLHVEAALKEFGL